MGKVTQSQIYARTHLDIKPKMRCNGRLLRANYQHDAMIYSLKKNICVDESLNSPINQILEISETNERKLSWQYELTRLENKIKCRKELM